MKISVTFKYQIGERSVERSVNAWLPYFVYKEETKESGILTIIDTLFKGIRNDIQKKEV